MAGQATLCPARASKSTLDPGASFDLTKDRIRLGLSPPARLEPTSSLIRITHGKLVLAETTQALRVLETSHPPVFYIPPSDIAMQHVVPSASRGSFCEF